MSEFIIQARSFEFAIPGLPGLISFIRHNFWVLMDSNGSIIAELNGLATDRKSGFPVAIGTNEVSHSLLVWQFVHTTNYAGTLEGGETKTTLQTMVRAGQPSEIVYKGEMADVFARWNKAVKAQIFLNVLDLNYPKYGFKLDRSEVNSNSTYRTLGEIMGIPVHVFSAWQFGLKNRMGPKITFTPMDGSGNEKFYAIGGGDGGDELRGGQGDDEYTINIAGELVIENKDEGIDTILTMLSKFNLSDNVENLTLTSKNGWGGIAAVRETI
ncbi:hypothetical protein PO883_06105 [Massilia sp. DJPM01]|uniref:hypothetical protein n=1 Tax=Massilia sp. DJPM01 TaxID=3024404 RepID=UPI00259D403D|nr:hypothetical protein [Massilia sp. DJPM01]MDM5176768.1 hypothetical protein [Massilia sp. DJPM01]